MTASKTFRICECCHASAQHSQQSSSAPAMLPQPVSLPSIYWLQLLPGLKGGDVAGGCSQGWQPSWSWGSPWGRWATADQMTAACTQSGRITICQSSLGISASTSPRYYHSLCRHLQGVSGLHDLKASAAHNSKSCTWLKLCLYLCQASACFDALVEVTTKQHAVTLSTCMATARQTAGMSHTIHHTPGFLHRPSS